MNAAGPGKFRDPALVDFGTDARGDGRRLERLGGVLVDRPLPHAGERRRLPPAWSEAAAVYRGTWEFAAPLPDPWQTRVPLAAGAALVLEVRPAPSGQIGVFLEQAAQWRWLAEHAPAAGTMLSLFAHSGAASLALATAGCEVVHVDASRQAITLARRNAAASGLAERPVRWVCEDAATFVARLLKRGTSCAGAVLDPPSWGHGPGGQAFAIDRDLAPLVADVARLMAAHRAGPQGPLLLTCHTPGWHSEKLEDTLRQACRTAGLSGGRFECGPLSCTDDSGRTLELGAFARRTPPA